MKFSSSSMSSLGFLVLFFFSMAGESDGGGWCVCKQSLSDTALQKTLDYACGAGADCNPILPNGVCFNPNSVKAHCSYAVNSYYQRKNQVAGTCDFAGTAITSSTDPSSPGCSYPSSASAASGSSTSVGSVGLGPSSSSSTDVSAAAFHESRRTHFFFFSFFISFVFIFIGHSSLCTLV